MWSLEGTKAHEFLETYMRAILEGDRFKASALGRGYTREMVALGTESADFIVGLHRKLEGSEILVETRIHLSFIHPEMFGTFDGAVVDYFGTLHVFDYKYGAGHGVRPRENLQMIFYGMGLAHRYGWDFKKVRLWIIQPRIKGYDGPTFWDLSIRDLKEYVAVFEAGVKRVEKEPDTYIEGSWCHWCVAKGVCPLKQEKKSERAISVFTAFPLPKGK